MTFVIAICKVLSKNICCCLVGETWHIHPHTKEHTCYTVYEKINWLSCPSQPSSHKHQKCRLKVFPPSWIINLSWFILKRRCVISSWHIILNGFQLNSPWSSSLECFFFFFFVRASQIYLFFLFWVFFLVIHLENGKVHL